LTESNKKVVPGSKKGSLTNSSLSELPCVT